MAYGGIEERFPHPWFVWSTSSDPEFEELRRLLEVGGIS